MFKFLKLFSFSKKKKVKKKDFPKVTELDYESDVQGYESELGEEVEGLKGLGPLLYTLDLRYQGVG